MTHPAVIRTEFASAEEAADLYGVPQDRVATIRRALTPEKRMMTQTRNGTGPRRISRGKKGRAKKK